MGDFSLSGGVEVFGFISPTSINDTYPVIDPLYGIDGFRNVDTISDLDNIPELRRRAGMVVGVSGGTSYYKLNQSPWNYNITDWSVFNSGSGGDYLPLSGGTVTGQVIFSGSSPNPEYITFFKGANTGAKLGIGVSGNLSDGITNDILNSGGTGYAKLTITSSEVVNNIVDDNGSVIMQNAFNITPTGDIIVGGVAKFTTPPTIGNTNDNFLTRNQSTGIIEVRELQTFPAINSFTFNTSTYVLTIGLNDGSQYTTNLSILAQNTFVTGGTYNGNAITFTNNTGGTFTVTGITSSTSFTGGTVTGATNFTNGLTANTISATTYQNLPLDIRVTGATYSNGSATFTNNTGGTFNVTGFYTGETDDNQYITGFTYNNNQFTISDNSGNTFNSTINTVTGLTVNGILSATTINGESLSIGDVINSDTTLLSDTSGFDSVNWGNRTLIDNIGENSVDWENRILYNSFGESVFDWENGSLTANTISATTISGGTFYGNGLPITKVNNIITVGLGGLNTDYSTIKDAVNSITGSSSANTYTVKVAGGVYYEDPFTIPTWVAVVGDSSVSTIIEANDSSQTLIKLSDQSALFDCQVQGCTDTNVSAILYSSSTTPQSSAISYVENVRFGSNYTNAKVVASGGANIIMQCSNVKYGGYPFTVGFYATNDGSGVGRMQLRNVTSTNGGVVSTTGLIFAKADALNCGFIVNGCLLTKATAGGSAGTGFYVENGGFLRLTSVNFQRWSVGIDAPQIGSAPSIDAIALNFENNTIDVNIAHSGATGKIQGTDNFLKTIINPNSPLYEVNQDPKEIIVAKKGGDFTSIKSAVDYLISSGNTSETNRYVISVGPGVFVEDEIDLTSTPYVSIVGSNIQTTQIVPRTNSQHIIKIGINNEISFLNLSGASSGYAGIYCYDVGDYAQVHKISMNDCDTGIWVESYTQDTKFYGEYVDFNGSYTYGTKVIGNNDYLALANMENYYNFPSGSNVTTCNYASGSGATLSVFVGDSQSNGVSGTTGYLVRDGAGLYCSTITLDGFTYGIINPNVGLPVRFDIDNASIVGGEWDLYVERNGTFGTFGGSASHAKFYSISSDVYWSFLDIEDGELDITRKASVTFSDGSHTDFTTLIFEGSSMGLLSGGTLTTVSGTTVQADGGFGYVEKSDNGGIVRRIDWFNNQITLSANTDSYIFINENGNLGSSGSRPNSFYNIILGRVVTNNTGVSFIDLTPFNAEHTSNRYGNLFSEALGPIYANGSIVTQGTTPFTLNVSEGEYYYSTNEITPTGGTGITFNQYYRNGTGATWVTSATTLVNNSQFDNNGTISPLPLSAYTKHTLYLVGEGSYEEYFLVLGQNQYSTLVQAEDALLPTPPTYFTDSVVQVANIYIQQGSTGITQVEDIRPVIGFKAGGVNASSVHGNLLGLTADDHTQYLLVNGGRAMSGDLSLGGNSLTNILTANGVTIESHATRHQFGGLDPVGSTTPSANAIPYADVSGTLDSWVSTATTTTLGRVKLSTNPVSSSNPIVIGDNDIRVARSLTGGTYSNGTATFTNNTGGTITLTGLTSTGVFGISNSEGTYTFYPTLTLAMSAATSGQTIEMFADVIETTNTSITLKSGVNINGNGHTYTLNQSGTANTIQDGGVSVNCAISNITFKRIGGIGSSTNTICMYITGASRLKLSSTNLLTNSNMRCLVVNNASAEIFNVYCEGHNPVAELVSGSIYNSEFRSLGGSGLSVLGSNAKAYKCTCYGLGASGIYMTAGEITDCIGTSPSVNGIDSYGGTLLNCVGYGGGGSGLYLNGGSIVAINCIGYGIAGAGILGSSSYMIKCAGYSSASVGISNVNGILYDCLGYSTANNGIYSWNSGASITEVRSCKAISLAAIAMFMDNTTSGCKIYNTEVYSKWNNAAGHGIKVSGNNVEIVQCTIEVTNSSANAINSSSVFTAKYANNAFKGSTTPINPNITQGIINTHDNYGNILI